MLRQSMGQLFQKLDVLLSVMKIDLQGVDEAQRISSALVESMPMGTSLPQDVQHHSWIFLQRLLQSETFIHFALRNENPLLGFLSLLLVSAHDGDENAEDIIVSSMIKMQLLGLFNDGKFPAALREKFYLGALATVNALAVDGPNRLQLFLDLLNLPLVVSLDNSIHDDFFIVRVCDMAKKICERTKSDAHFPICAEIVARLRAKGFKLRMSDGSVFFSGPVTLLHEAVQIGWHQLIPVLVAGEDGIPVDTLARALWLDESALSSCYDRDTWFHDIKYPGKKANLWRCGEALVMAGAQMHLNGMPMRRLMEGFVWRKCVDPSVTEAQIASLLQSAIGKETAMQDMEKYVSQCAVSQREWSDETLAAMQRIFAAARTQTFTAETTHHRNEAGQLVMPPYARWPTPLRVCVMGVLALAACRPADEAPYHPACHLRRLPREILYLILEALKSEYDAGRSQKSLFAFLGSRAKPAVEDVVTARGAAIEELSDDSSEDSYESSSAASM